MPRPVVHWQECCNQQQDSVCLLKEKDGNKDFFLLRSKWKLSTKK